MPSILNKPSDYYIAVVNELSRRIKNAAVMRYALHGEHQVQGVECHVIVSDYGELSQHNDGRIKQPVQVTVHCIVSKAISDSEQRNADLLAQDLASAVGRIAFKNHFGLKGLAGFPEKVKSQEGMFKDGAEGYECWETEWWQTIYLGEKPDDEPVVTGIFLAVNPVHPEKPDEYEEVEHVSGCYPTNNPV